MTEPFRFPKHIVYCGRFMTGIKLVRYKNSVACLYKDDELECEQTFSANEFKYNEHYGYIERRNV